MSTKIFIFNLWTKIPKKQYFKLTTIVHPFSHLALVQNKNLNRKLIYSDWIALFYGTLSASFIWCYQNFSLLNLWRVWTLKKFSRADQPQDVSACVKECKFRSLATPLNRFPLQIDRILPIITHILRHMSWIRNWYTCGGLCRALLHWLRSKILWNCVTRSRIDNNFEQINKSRGICRGAHRGWF